MEPAGKHDYEQDRVTLVIEERHPTPEAARLRAVFKAGMRRSRARERERIRTSPTWHWTYPQINRPIHRQKPIRLLDKARCRKGQS